MPLAGTSESVTAAQSATDLVATYLPLVGHLVRETSASLPAHLTATDLVPAGLHALATSARRHCATTTATPFAQAAIADIRAALATAVHARGAEAQARPAAVRDALVDVLGREPRQDEIARTIGLRAPGRTENVRTLPQPARPDRTVDVRTAMERLPEQLRVIVAELYLKQRRVAEVAAELDLPETEVARLRSLALAELGALMASGSTATLAPAGSAVLASRAAVAAHAPTLPSTSRSATVTRLRTGA